MQQAPDLRRLRSLREAAQGKRTTELKFLGFPHWDHQSPRPSSKLRRVAYPGGFGESAMPQGFTGSSMGGGSSAFSSVSTMSLGDGSMMSSASPQLPWPNSGGGFGSQSGYLSGGGSNGGAQSFMNSSSSRFASSAGSPQFSSSTNVSPQLPNLSRMDGSGGGFGGTNDSSISPQLPSVYGGSGISGSGFSASPQMPSLVASGGGGGGGGGGGMSASPQLPNLDGGNTFASPQLPAYGGGGGGGGGGNMFASPQLPSVYGSSSNTSASPQLPARTGSGWKSDAGGTAAAAAAAVGSAESSMNSPSLGPVLSASPSLGTGFGSSSFSKPLFRGGADPVVGGQEQANASPRLMSSSFGSPQLLSPGFRGYNNEPFVSPALSEPREQITVNINSDDYGRSPRFVGDDDGDHRSSSSPSVAAAAVAAGSLAGGRSDSAEVATTPQPHHWYSPISNLFHHHGGEPQGNGQLQNPRRNGGGSDDVDDDNDGRGFRGRDRVGGGEEDDDDQGANDDNGRDGSRTGGGLMGELLDSKVLLFLLLGVGIYFVLKGLGNYCRNDGSSTMCQLTNAVGQAMQALGNAATKLLNFATSTAGQITIIILGILIFIGMIISKVIGWDRFKDGMSALWKKMTGKDAQDPDDIRTQAADFLREIGEDETADNLRSADEATSAAEIAEVMRDNMDTVARSYEMSALVRSTEINDGIQAAMSTTGTQDEQWTDIFSKMGESCDKLKAGIQSLSTVFKSGIQSVDAISPTDANSRAQIRAALQGVRQATQRQLETLNEHINMLQTQLDAVKDALGKGRVMSSKDRASLSDLLDRLTALKAAKVKKENDLKALLPKNASGVSDEEAVAAMRNAAATADADDPLATSTDAAGASARTMQTTATESAANRADARDAAPPVLRRAAEPRAWSVLQDELGGRVESGPTILPDEDAQGENGNAFGGVTADALKSNPMVTSLRASVKKTSTVDRIAGEVTTQGARTSSLFDRFAAGVSRVVGRVFGRSPDTEDSASSGGRTNPFDNFPTDTPDNPAGALYATYEAQDKMEEMEGNPDPAVDPTSTDTNVDETTV